MKLDEVVIGEHLFDLLEQGKDIVHVPVTVKSKGPKRVVVQDSTYNMIRIVGAQKLSRRIV